MAKKPEKEVAVTAPAPVNDGFEVISVGENTYLVRSALMSPECLNVLRRLDTACRLSHAFGTKFSAKDAAMVTVVLRDPATVTLC